MKIRGTGQSLNSSQFVFGMDVLKHSAPSSSSFLRFSPFCFSCRGSYSAHRRFLFAMTHACSDLSRGVACTRKSTYGVQTDTLKAHQCILEQKQHPPTTKDADKSFHQNILLTSSTLQPGYPFFSKFLPS